MFERLFKLKESGTDVKTEVVGGITTFMTLAYIIIVQPTVLSKCGMDFGAVMVATCLSSALGTLLMAFTANYPIALAPAMGHNFFFVFTICLVMGVSWQVALGVNFLSGMFFLISSVVAFRKKIIQAIPETLKSAIAVGIGLLIALVGFEWAGIVVDAPGTLVGLGNLRSAPVLLALFGTALIAALMCLRVRGAILIGILVTTLAGLPFGLTKFEGIVSMPPSLAPTFMKLHIPGAFSWNLVTVIFIMFFLDLFDTIGTLVGVGEVGGFTKGNKLPRSNRALFADAGATVAGTMLGTSTVTAYVESTAGVLEGARTGLANLVTAALMILAIFFYPLVKMVGAGVEVAPNVVLHPITAPALIIVGSMMMRSVAKINWTDVSEAIPAFLTVIIMPVTMSITEGISFGFISFAFLKLVSGKGKEVHPIVYVFAVLFVLRHVFLKH